MKKIKREHFECIKEDNSEEEDKKQWKKSQIIFDQFYEYLKNKGLKESTASTRAEMAAYFIMEYLFVYDDVLSILEVSGDTIRTFLGNWYIRKFMNPRMSEIKSFLRAISDFFTFIKNEGFITDDDLKEIKEVCKDLGWFEMRLHTYFAAEGNEFYEWIEEYNYDWL
jgi:site-specific recombinase XerD